MNRGIDYRQKIHAFYPLKGQLEALYKISQLHGLSIVKILREGVDMVIEKYLGEETKENESPN